MIVGKEKNKIKKIKINNKIKKNTKKKSKIEKTEKNSIKNAKVRVSLPCGKSVRSESVDKGFKI